MISYAGVPLRTATTEVALWVEQNISLADVIEFAPRYTPGAGLESVPFVPHRPAGPVRLGRLTWPVGAQRFAIGHYLCTSADLDRIRNVVYSNGLGYQAGELILDSGDGAKVETDLWMLPPRPLGGVGDPPELWLLTLVDDRYWWWFRGASIGAQSSWTNLYLAIGQGIGTTITVETIPAAYLAPPDDLLSRYRALPVLLDGVASSLGQRIVRSFDGTVTAQNPTSARTSWEAEQTTYAARRMAGGGMRL